MVHESKRQYEIAKKSAIRARNINQAKGLDTHIKILDHLTSTESIISEVSLGIKDIPLKKIVGTMTNGRAISFGPNFMPIMNETSEFAAKWQTLYQAQIEDGIRDSIKVYEYLNRYYVVEGNKRVSVMKFLKAHSIPGYVTRLLPKYNDTSNEIMIYYGLLEFKSKTGIDYIWMSDPDNYNKLYKWLKKYELDIPEARNNAKYFFNDFRDVYHSLGGDKIDITTGDAFLEYFEVYAYKADYTQELLRINIKKLWNELSLLTDEEHVAIETSSQPIPKKGFIANIVSLNTNKTHKIAFIHSKSPLESRWTYEHEVGRQHIQSVFGDSIETTSVYDVSETEDAYSVLKDLADKEYDIMFTTAPTFIRPTLKAALEFPNIKFLNCSENMSYKNIRTYFGRIYEPNFLVGMIAGSLTTTNKLAYIASYPVTEVINSINAFTLGARFVNSSATVQVKWIESIDRNSIETVKAVDCQLLELGIDIVLHEESADYYSMKKFKGIYKLNNINCSDDTYQLNKAHRSEGISLATPLWNWGNFYEKLVNNIISGAYNKVSNVLNSNDRAINYWWGMKENVVDIDYSKENLPLELVRSVEFMKKMIISGDYKIFKGPIYNNKNELMIKEDENLTTHEVLKINWLVDGVLGSIPNISTLEDSHPLLEMINFKKW